MRKARLLVQGTEEDHPDVCSQRAESISNGLMSYEVHFSSMCAIRGREAGTQLASSGHSGRGVKFQESEGQHWRKRQEHRSRG